jgi:hypothetical protein
MAFNFFRTRKSLGFQKKKPVIKRVPVSESAVKANPVFAKTQKLDLRKASEAAKTRRINPFQAEKLEGVIGHYASYISSFTEALNQNKKFSDEAQQVLARNLRELDERDEELLRQEPFNPNRPKDDNVDRSVRIYLRLIDLSMKLEQKGLLGKGFTHKVFRKNR